MALPAQFSAAVATGGFTVSKWIEIEGIPNAFGNLTKAGSWFSGRAAAAQKAQILPYMTKTPSNLDAELDVLQGIAEGASVISFSIADIDGEQTLWAGAKDNRKWLFTSGALTSSGLSLTVIGTVDNAYYPTTGGTIHIGNEAIAYSSRAGQVFTLSTRGMYGSTPRAWASGSIVSYKPVTLYGRRVDYYMVAQADTTTAAAPTDADKVLRFSGTVESYALDAAEPTSYTLTAVSIEKMLTTKKLFRDLRSVVDTTKQGLSDETPATQGLRLTAPIGGSGTRFDQIVNPGVLQTNDADNSRHFVNGDHLLFRVDNEIIGVLANTLTPPANLQLIARGCMGTEIAEHKPGFTLKELAWVARYVDSGTSGGAFEHTYSKLTAAASSSYSTIPPDHPFVFLLCVLMSTGTGSNTPGGGERAYDVLPASWGLGIPYTRIDYAAIERLAEENPDLRIGGVFEEAITFIELAQQVLAPFGFYAVTKIGDLFTIKKLEAPMPDEGTRALTAGDIISGSQPSWDANLLGLVQQITYRYSFDLAAGEYLVQDPTINVLGEQYAQGNGRTLEYDMPLVYAAGPQRIPGKPTLGGMSDVEGALRKRVDFFIQAYAIPPPLLALTCTYDFLNVEPGDLVSVTRDNLPQVQTGTRGLTAQVMRCIRKTIDDDAKVVQLTLQDVGYDFSAYRYWAAALEITAFNAGAKTITVALHSFTAPAHGTQDFGTDLLPKDNAGVAHDLHAAIAAAVVHIVSKDFHTRSALTSGSTVNTTTGVITCVDALPASLAVGDFVIVETQGYSGVIAALQASPWYMAFLDDGDGVLADAVSPAARWVT